MTEQEFIERAGCIENAYHDGQITKAERDESLELLMDIRRKIMQYQKLQKRLNRALSRLAVQQGDKVYSGWRRWVRRSL